jgi:hypothetical protein
MVHVLQRLNWVWTHDTAMTDHPISLLMRIPGVVRLRTFLYEVDALGERDRLEEEARRNVNPFLCGGTHLRHQTRFDGDRLHDWLLDGGIQPPEDRDWVAWWPTVRDDLDEPQWRHVWHALDRLSFYEVVLRPASPVVYVLGQVGWRYNDQGFDPAPEGSKPMRAFRSRERALSECEDENDIARSALDVDNEGMNDSGEEFDMHERVRRMSPFCQVEKHAPVFYEVVEVELASLMGPQS